MPPEGPHQAHPRAGTGREVSFPHAGRGLTAAGFIPAARTTTKQTALYHSNLPGTFFNGQVRRADQGTPAARFFRGASSPPPPPRHLAASLAPETLS